MAVPQNLLFHCCKPEEKHLSLITSASDPVLILQQELNKRNCGATVCVGSKTKKFGIKRVERPEIINVK